MILDFSRHGDTSEVPSPGQPWTTSHPHLRLPLHHQAESRHHDLGTRLVFYKHQGLVPAAVVSLFVKRVGIKINNILRFNQQITASNRWNGNSMVVKSTYINSVLQEAPLPSCTLPEIWADWSRAGAAADLGSSSEPDRGWAFHITCHWDLKWHTGGYLLNLSRGRCNILYQK